MNKACIRIKGNLNCIGAMPMLWQQADKNQNELNNENI